MAHNHDHNHDERELITLVDEQGNETLFEILLTIDGKEEFGKNYVLPCIPYCEFDSCLFRAADFA